MTGAQTFENFYLLREKGERETTPLVAVLGAQRILKS